MFLGFFKFRNKKWTKKYFDPPSNTKYKILLSWNDCYLD